MSSYSHNFAVCIGRQLGSGGRNVALAISRKMGIAFYDKEIINQAAKDSGLDPEYFEKVDEKPTIPILGGLAGVHIPFFSGGYLDTESYLGNNNLFKIQRLHPARPSAGAVSVHHGHYGGPHRASLEAAVRHP